MGFKYETGIQNKFRIKLYKGLVIMILETNPNNKFQSKQQALTKLLTLEELLLEDEELLDLSLFFGGLLTYLSVTFVLLLFLSRSGSSPFFVKAANSGTFT